MVSRESMVMGCCVGVCGLCCWHEGSVARRASRGRERMWCFMVGCFGMYRCKGSNLWGKKLLVGCS